MHQNCFRGNIPFSMTNDFVFKYLLQESEDTLRAIICSFLDVSEDEIESVDVTNPIHLGFLDYSLFPDTPAFYSTYRLYDEKTHNLYSSKFRISVVDLKHIELATTEDKQFKRHLWSRFFKSKTWEELDMLATQDENIKKTVVHLRKLSEEEHFRLQCEAREDRIRQEIDFHNYYKREIQKRDDALAEQAKQICEQEKRIDEQEKIIKEIQAKLDMK